MRVDRIWRRIEGLVERIGETVGAHAHAEMVVEAVATLGADAKCADVDPGAVLTDGASARFGRRLRVSWYRRERQGRGKSKRHGTNHAVLPMSKAAFSWGERSG